MGFQNLDDFSNRSRSFARSAGEFLTKEEEGALWQTWFENPDEKARQGARETLLTKHLPLCKRMAEQWAKKNPLSADDFFSEAYTEMTASFEKYDRMAGARFSTFTEQRIQSALKDAAINAGPVKLVTTKRASYMFSNWGKLNREALRADPSINDYQRHKKIAALVRAYNPEEFKNITPNEVAAFEARLQSHHNSLDKPIKSEDSMSASFLDFLEASWGNAAQRLEDNDLDRTKLMLHRIIDSPKLDDRERTIIKQRHLSDQEDCRTLNDLAQEFGVSAERVRQIEEEGLRKLRQAMKWRPLSRRTCAQASPD